MAEIMRPSGPWALERQHRALTCMKPVSTRKWLQFAAIFGGEFLFVTTGVTFVTLAMRRLDILTADGKKRRAQPKLRDRRSDADIEKFFRTHRKDLCPTCVLPLTLFNQIPKDLKGYVELWVWTNETGTRSRAELRLPGAKEEGELIYTDTYDHADRGDYLSMETLFAKKGKVKNASLARVNVDLLGQVARCMGGYTVRLEQRAASYLSIWPVQLSASSVFRYKYTRPGVEEPNGYGGICEIQV
jgi:hypothetical protein